MGGKSAKKDKRGKWLWHDSGGGDGVSGCSVKIYVITTSGHTHNHVEIDHTIYYAMCENNNNNNDDKAGNINIK